MLKGFTENGELKDIKVTENGELKVAMEGGSIQQTVVTNTSENPVPVNIQNESTVIGNTASNPVPVNIQNQSTSTTINNTTNNPVPVNMQNESIIVGNTTSSPIPVDMQNESIVVGNTASNPIPVSVAEAGEVEKTLNASVKTLGTTATKISIGKKVTSIDIANYSDTESINVILENLSVNVPDFSSLLDNQYDCYVLFKSTYDNSIRLCIFKSVDKPNDYPLFNETGDRINFVNNLNATAKRYSIEDNTWVYKADTNLEQTNINNIYASSVDLYQYINNESIKVSDANPAYKQLAQVGNNVAITLPVNENVGSINLTATAADTKAQIVVKGVN